MAGSPRLVCSYRKNNARRQRLSLHRDQAAIRHHHQPADRNPECHGAHSREGQLLAILAMLALKCALRVAAGGFPTPPLRSVAGALPGRDGKGRQK